MRIRFLLLSVLMHCAPALADDCAWLPAAVVDEAMPAQAPWRSYENAQGRCSFSAQAPGPRRSITVIRNYHGSAAAAADASTAMREALASLFTARPEPTLGAAGFSGVAEIIGGELLNMIGHRDRLYVEVKFGFADGIRDEYRPVALGLADRALGTAAQLAATEDLAQCPHLDVAVLRPRFAEARVSLPTQDACLIRSAGQSLTIERERQSDPDDLIQYMIDERCATAAVPALGASARLLWNCAGNRTRLLHAEGTWLVSYEYASGQASTPQDREWLSAVAQARGVVTQ